MEPPLPFVKNRSFEDQLGTEVQEVADALVKCIANTKGFSTRPEEIKRAKLENVKAARSGKKLPYNEGILALCETDKSSAELERKKIIHDLMSNPVTKLIEALRRVLEAERQHASEVDQFLREVYSVESNLASGVDLRINYLSREDPSESRFYCPQTYFAGFVQF